MRLTKVEGGEIQHAVAAIVSHQLSAKDTSLCVALCSLERSPVNVGGKRRLGRAELLGLRLAVGVWVKCQVCRNMLLELVLSHEILRGELKPSIWAAISLFRIQNVSPSLLVRHMISHDRGPLFSFVPQFFS